MGVSDYIVMQILETNLGISLDVVSFRCARKVGS